MSQTLEKYTYDDFGNQTLETTYELDTQTATSSKSKEVRNTYDTANQLIKVEEKTTGNWTTLNTSLYNGQDSASGKQTAALANGDYTMYFYMGGALAFSTNSDATTSRTKTSLTRTAPSSRANGRTTHTTRTGRRAVLDLPLRRPRKRNQHHRNGQERRFIPGGKQRL